MAKISRSLLKGIVKECLVEILAEGLGTESDLNENLSPRKRPARKQTVKKAHRSAVDTISFNSSVDDTVKNITSDPVMAQILADTAKTTLQEQYAAGEPGGQSMGDPGIDLNSLGGDLFSGASQNWAYLAFDDKKS